MFPSLDTEHSAQLARAWRRKEGLREFEGSWRGGKIVDVNDNDVNEVDELMSENTMIKYATEMTRVVHDIREELIPSAAALLECARCLVEL